MAIVAATQLAQEARAVQSLFDLLWSGGPVMIPIALASVVALAFAVERWIRLRPSELGSGARGEAIVAAVREGGAPRGLEACRAQDTPTARVLAVGLERARAPFLEREKAVEDTASREVRGLAGNLRPLYLVYLVAPLLGLLGTVWGMIEAFSNIATSSGLGRPELLATGIYQALVTTAAGLTIAIPALVVHHHLKGRIERFARRVEQLYEDVEAALARAPSPVRAEAVAAAEASGAGS